METKPIEILMKLNRDYRLTYPKKQRIIFAKKHSTKAHCYKHMMERLQPLSSGHGIFMMCL